MSKARCNCGKFQLEVPAAQATAICLCRSCTRGGGSIASYNAVIIKEDIKWIKGSLEETTKYEDKETDSGKVLGRHFCGTCGSPLLSVPAEGPVSYFKGQFKMVSLRSKSCALD